MTRPAHHTGKPFVDFKVVAVRALAVDADAGLLKNGPESPLAFGKIQTTPGQHFLGPQPQRPFQGDGQLVPIHRFEKQPIRFGFAKSRQDIVATVSRDENDRNAALVQGLAKPYSGSGVRQQHIKQGNIGILIGSNLHSGRHIRRRSDHTISHTLKQATQGLA